MPWYIGDYLKDTMHLNAEQDGAYRRLIDACWIAAGPIEANDEQFAIITKLGMRRWLAVKPVIEKFFKISSDGWRHKRVDEELAKAEFLYRRAQAGGRAKAKISSNGHDFHEIKQVRSRDEADF
ncbi:MAG: DUF1376 domain-containing protein [Patescibacteria group bacterium]|nr:DUF1376 domain-containing protein [Patescibacteria group bacterium]